MYIFTYVAAPLEYLHLNTTKREINSEFCMQSKSYSSVSLRSKLQLKNLPTCQPIHTNGQTLPWIFLLF